jgi:hypothetical protein
MSWFLAVIVLSNRVVITEVMANPRGDEGAHYPEDRNEFVELFNAGREAIDLYNYRLTDGDAVDDIRIWTDSTILVQQPNVIIGTTWLKPGGYAVILDPEYTDPEAQGGFVQPYRFGDSTLILTVGNTTLGNGLAINDPVIIFGYDDSSSFGTPFNSGDGFPANPGDGFTWERVDTYGLDSVDNWAVCPETSGCTPGRANAAGLRIDIAIAGVELADSGPAVSKDSFWLRVEVENRSYVFSPAGTIRVWFYPGETVAVAGLVPMKPRSETGYVFTGRYLPTAGELWVKAVVPGDRDTINNLARLMIYPHGENRLLSPELKSFSPDGDGFEDSLRISYQLPVPGGRLRLRVFDLAGRTVKRLIEDQIPVALHGQVCWNGSDEQGRGAQSGIFLVVLDYRPKDRRIRAVVPVVLIRKKG